MKARAKINLALDVINRRQDGYHNLVSIMQTLSLYDTLLIKKVDKFPFKFVCNTKWLPTDDKNIVFKTAKLLINEYNIKDGVFIELVKNIPISAGLAGGSSDCAATLIGMRKLFDLPISNDELLSIGKSLGADVPYCIMRGTMLAEGIGEKLTPIIPPHPSNVYVLLVRPPIFVSTATVFKKLDLNKVTERPNIGGIIRHIRKGDIRGVARNFCNVLETVTINMHPIILDIKNTMQSCNTLGCLMSGSGPTVFGYFERKEHAFFAASVIKKRFPAIRDIFITTIFNPYTMRRR